jgi:RecA/RadA recombinase
MTISWPEEIPSHVKRVLQARFANPLDVLFHTDRELAEFVGLSITSAREVQRNISQLYAPAPISALEALISTKYLHSCLPSLDAFLGGGLQESWLVELVGEAGSGKTQWAMSIAATALLQGSRVFWLDTENTFRPDRLIDFLPNRADLLSNLLTKRCSLLSELLDSLLYISNVLASEAITLTNPPLIVLDSIASPTLSLSSRLIDRTELLCRITRAVKSMKAVTIATNHMRARLHESNSRPEPALGNTWAQNINIRFLLGLAESPNSKERWVEVRKAPGIDQPCSFKVNIRIEREGIKEL